MKKTIIVLLWTTVSMLTMAQNGGQANENNYGRLTYLGYENGHYVLELANKQACGVDFHLQWLHKDTTIFVGKQAAITIQLPGGAIGNLKIKARPLYKCGSSGGDMGQLEIITPAALPVTFVSVTAPRVSDTEFMVTWHISNPVNVNTYRVQTSSDGLTWQEAGLVWPGQENRYKVKINLATKK